MTEPVGAPDTDRIERDERSNLELAVDILDTIAAGFHRAAANLGDLAGDATDIWESVEDGVANLGEELEDLGRGLSDWSARASRLWSSAWVLGQITASYRFENAIADIRSTEGAAAALAGLHARNAERFYRAAVRQGGGFVKVGQLLSARMDLLPEPWIRELSRLQDAMPAAPFDTSRATIEEDLGRPLAELFASFDEEPVAAASIGQVYRAVTPDGRTVAVKVQHPDIQSLIELDLSLFELSFEALTSMLPPTDYETISSEVRRMVLTELDYANEAQMMSRVADFFEDHPGILVPRPVPHLCGKRVLTANFVAGRKITEVLDEWKPAREAGGAEAERRTARVLGLLLECYLSQVLEAGVFQADPHPGNLLVTDDDRLVLLDFGCTKPMPEAVRARYLDLVGCFVKGDRDGMARSFGELGFATESGRPDTLHAFADAILRGFQKSLADGGAFAWMSPDELLEQATQLLEVAHDDPVIRLPEEFVMLGRVFATLGGLFHHYQPQIDYGAHLVPILARALAEPPAT